MYITYILHILLRLTISTYNIHLYIKCSYEHVNMHKIQVGLQNKKVYYTKTNLVQTTKLIEI